MDNRNHQNGNGHGVHNLMHEALDKVWHKVSDLGLASSVKSVTLTRSMAEASVSANCKLVLVITETAMAEPVESPVIVG